ncbi:hypothetical protein GCM10010492_52180 [Saccharothrix mutabilis subsp. mutabilis]|uniref:Uncharacterized protein n=1 Tax=Saccharothrix mutabilis subsp. mutabilis TaxID=66855 RepID=A0ABN0UCP0_9PSEU
MVVGAVGWLGAGDGSAALRAEGAHLPRTDRRDRAGGPLGGRRGGEGPLGGRRGGGGDEPWTGDPRPAQPARSRATADTPWGAGSPHGRATAGTSWGIEWPQGRATAGTSRGVEWPQGRAGVRPSRGMRVGERAAPPRGPAVAGEARASWGAGPPQGPAAAGVGRDPRPVRSSWSGAGARPARS